MPVKAKRKRTPPAAPSEFEVPASAEGTTSKGVKSDRGLQPWSVLLPSVQSRPTEQPEVSSSSSAAGPSVGDGGVKEERPDLVHATTSHEHLSGQWGLAPPTMDDYMRRAQQLNGPVPSEPYCTGQQQQQQQQHLPGASSGHPSYTRYAPPPHPPPLVAGQHGLQPATHDGPPAYSAGLAPPSRYDGSHAQSSPVAPPQHLQPYPQPTPSPQMPFTTYAPARGSRKSAAASSAQHDVEVHGGQHLAHSPYAPQPQTLQPAQLAPLADLQRPMSTFQTPSHVDLPVPVLPQARPHPDQAAADQQHPNGADPGPRAVNLATPSRPPFYAPPNGDVTYFEHPYAPPKETNHRILDHLIERVVEHGFILPDTAGSALRARPDGSGSYVAAAEGLPSSNGTASEYGHHRSEEDVRQAHAEGQGRELVRSQSPGSNRLVLNDLLLPKDLADSSFAAQASASLNISSLDSSADILLRPAAQLPHPSLSWISSAAPAAVGVPHGLAAGADAAQAADVGLSAQNLVGRSPRSVWQHPTGGLRPYHGRNRPPLPRIEPLDCLLSHPVCHPHQLDLKRTQC